MSSEGALDLQSTLQVARELEILGRREQTAEVGDVSYAIRLGTAREVVGADQVHVVEAPLRQASRRHHRVDEIERRISPCERSFGVAQVGEIAGASLYPIAPRVLRRGSGQRDDVVVGSQRLDERAAHEAARARDGDPLPGGLGLFAHRFEPDPARGTRASAKDASWVIPSQKAE